MAFHNKPAVKKNCTVDFFRIFYKFEGPIQLKPEYKNLEI